MRRQERKLGLQMPLSRRRLLALGAAIVAEASAAAAIARWKKEASKAPNAGALGRERNAPVRKEHQHCLEEHNIHARFVSLQTADRHPSKPHPSMVHEAMVDAGAAPETTIVIGDTSFDMAMAAAAGATPIGAGWGYHDAEELIEAGAVAVAETPLEVLDLVREHANG